jgi:hypothetical protein
MIYRVVRYDRVTERMRRARCGARCPGRGAHGRIAARGRFPPPRRRQLFVIAQQGAQVLDAHDGRAGQVGEGSVSGLAGAALDSPGGGLIGLRKGCANKISIPQVAIEVWIDLHSFGSHRRLRSARRPRGLAGGQECAGTGFGRELAERLVVGKVVFDCGIVEINPVEPCRLCYVSPKTIDKG